MAGEQARGQAEKDPDDDVHNRLLHGSERFTYVVAGYCWGERDEGNNSPGFILSFSAVLCPRSSVHEKTPGLPYHP